MKLYRLLSITALVFGLQACEGAGPTAAGRAHPEEFSPVSASNGDRWVTCSLYQRGFRGGHQASLRVKQFAVRIPPEEQGPGATRSYTYRGYSNGAELTAYADCVIPATDAARRRMDHLLRAGTEGPTRLSLAPAGTLFSTGDPIQLSPVVVTACQYGGRYPNCSQQPEDYEVDNYECMWYGNCPAEYSPGGSGGATAGTASWTDWFYPQDDGTNRPPCERDADSICVTRAPSVDEWNKLGQRIDAIKDDSDLCRAVKAGLQSMYNQGRAAGRFRFWYGYDIDSEGLQRYGQHLSDANGSFIEFDGFWVLDARMPTLLIHEGLHKYLHDTNSTMPLDQSHAWIADVEDTCV
jgi:hypothetical protein